MGFIPLVHCKGTDYAAFFSAQSANKPKVYAKAYAVAKKDRFLTTPIT